MMKRIQLGAFALFVFGTIGWIGRERADCQERLPKSPIAKGEIVLYGHSLFTQWRTAKEDLDPLPVHNLAFGGSRTSRLTEEFDKLVAPHKPRLIVLNTGANFLGFNRRTPQEFQEAFEELLDKIHEELPETKILWMSITPCPRAWESMRKKQQEGTRLAKLVIEQREYVDFVDMDSIAVNDNGELIKEIFKADGIHYVRAGYEGYIRALKPSIEVEWRRLADSNR